MDGLKYMGYALSGLVLTVALQAACGCVLQAEKLVIVVTGEQDGTDVAPVEVSPAPAEESMNDRGEIVDAGDLFALVSGRKEVRTNSLAIKRAVEGIRNADLQKVVLVGDGDPQVQELPCGLAIAMDPSGRVLGFGVSENWTPAHPCPILEHDDEDASAAHRDGASLGDGEEAERDREDPAIRSGEGGDTLRDEVSSQGRSPAGGVGGVACRD